MQERRDSGLDACRKGMIQDWRDKGKEGFRTKGMRGIQERWYEGKEG